MGDFVKRTTGYDEVDLWITQSPFLGPDREVKAPVPVRGSVRAANGMIRTRREIEELRNSVLDAEVPEALQD